MIRAPISQAGRESADPGLLIESATREVHDARKRHRREVVEQTRLRRLVERVDSAIELCEETHLQGIKAVPPDVAVRARKVCTFARGAVRKTGNAEGMAAAGATGARRQGETTDVADSRRAVESDGP